MKFKTESSGNLEGFFDEAGEISTEDFDKLKDFEKDKFNRCIFAKGGTMDNDDLKQTYDEMHKIGRESWNADLNESMMIIQALPSWEGLKVLEIGCGEGDLAAFLHSKGRTDVTGLDYSVEAISKAMKKYLKGPVFSIVGDEGLEGHEGDYDVVIMQGVLEHFDQPFQELKLIIDKFLVEDGVLITTSPGFINPRGYVWMALSMLFDVQMSKTDIHFLNPWEFQDFCENNGLEMELYSCDQNWGGGKRTIYDFKERLQKALGDQLCEYEEKVDKFLLWMEKAMKLTPQSGLTGATISYKMWRKGKR